MPDRVDIPATKAALPVWILRNRYATTRLYICETSANQPTSGALHFKAAMHAVAASKLVTLEPGRLARGVVMPLAEALFLETRALERLDIRVVWLCLGDLEKRKESLGGSCQN